MSVLLAACFVASNGLGILLAGRLNRLRLPGTGFPLGFGTVGMLLDFAAATLVARLTPPPPAHVQRLIDSIRVPRGAGAAHEISA